QRVRLLQLAGQARQLRGRASLRLRLHPAVNTDARVPPNAARGRSCVRTDSRRAMKTIDTLGDLRGKRVLVRSDFNVPLDGTTITADGRIRAALPTLTALLDAGAKVIATAHLGRPKGAPEPKYSLAPVAKRLGELLGREVLLAEDTVGEDAKAKAQYIEEGQVLLLENIRFDAR